eukprot:gene10615-2737_t
MAHTFQLDVVSKGLGFTIAGGIDAPNKVTDVHENGAAREAGLREGDKLISVNGKSLVNVDHASAVDIIKNEIPSQSLIITADRSQSQGQTKNEQAGGHPTDRLELARKAYQSQDPELSRLAHELGSAPEVHQTGTGQYIKAAVFGGLDGIITTFAVVASVTGANLPIGVSIVMGVANLIGDGISMAFGEYMSSASEKQYTLTERRREEWEFDSNPEGEIKEMIDIYKEKGFDEEEAEQILRMMAKHRDFFIDHMMVEELGLMTPDPDESPLMNGVVIFVSFLLFGFTPLFGMSKIYVSLPTLTSKLSEMPNQSRYLT